MCVPCRPAADECKLDEMLLRTVYKGTTRGGKTNRKTFFIFPNRIRCTMFSSPTVPGKNIKEAFFFFLSFGIECSLRSQFSHISPSLCSYYVYRFDSQSYTFWGAGKKKLPSFRVSLTSVYQRENTAMGVVDKIFFQSRDCVRTTGLLLL